jgi:putative ABC transport system substrate-binding protein
VRRVLALYDVRDESPRQGVAAARGAAAALGITLVTREVRNGDEVKRALTALDEVDALLGIPGGVLSAHYAEMIRAANAKRLPTIVHTRTPSTRDALLTYGVSDVEVARQAARVLNKLVQGANAGELPVERPTRLMLVVNLKTARAIKLTVPRTLLLQANEIIE